MMPVFLQRLIIYLQCWMVFLHLYPKMCCSQHQLLLPPVPLGNWEVCVSRWSCEFGLGKLLLHIISVMVVSTSHGLAIGGRDKNVGCKPWFWSVQYMWFRYDFHAYAFNRIWMTLWPRLGACFICLVFKSEMHQPEIVAFLVTMQCKHSVIAKRLIPFFFHEERWHNEKLWWLVK